MTAGELARELLDYFGPEGEHWLQGRLTNRLSGAQGKRCFHGAVAEIVLGRPQYASDTLGGLVAPFLVKVHEQYPQYPHETIRYPAISRPMMEMESFNDLHPFGDLRVILEKVAADE